MAETRKPRRRQGSAGGQTQVDIGKVSSVATKPGLSHVSRGVQGGLGGLGLKKTQVVGFPIWASKLGADSVQSGILGGGNVVPLQR